MSDFHRALTQLELTNQNEKSESAQLRSDELVKQQHLEASFNEYLTLKDQKYPDNALDATTPETSGEVASSLSRPQHTMPKMPNESQLVSQPHLTSAVDPVVSLKPKLKDSMLVRQGDGDKRSEIDGKQNKFILKSDTKTTGKKLP